MVEGGTKTPPDRIGYVSLVKSWQIERMRSSAKGNFTPSSDGRKFMKCHSMLCRGALYGVEIDLKEKTSSRRRLQF